MIHFCLQCNILAREDKLIESFDISNSSALRTVVSSEKYGLQKGRRSLEDLRWKMQQSKLLLFLIIQIKAT